MQGNFFSRMFIFWTDLFAFLFIFVAGLYLVGVAKYLFSVGC